MGKRAAIPDDLRYNRTHVWCKVEDGVATIGITEFSLKGVSGLLFIELPDKGDDVLADLPFGEIESEGEAKDILCTVDGEVIDVNWRVAESPANLAEDPYGKGWLIKVRMSKPSQIDELMSAEEYQKYVEAQKK